MKKLYASFILICAAISASSQTLLGTAVAEAPGPNYTQYRLTTNMPIEQAGAVWRAGTVDATQNWTIKASLNFGQWTETNQDPSKPPAYRSGADGIAFVMAPAAYLGQFGEEVGYGTTTTGGVFTPNSSLAIEMDTWRNVTTGFNGSEGYRNHNDPDGNHIAIMSRGQTIHGTPDQLMAPVTPGGDFEDNQWHDVTISWVAATRTISLTSTSGFPFSASASLTPAQVTSIFGGATMLRVGFTAATGSAGNEHRVRFINVPDCSGFRVMASLPALGCSNGNVLYLGYGPQSITATSSDPNTTFTWYRIGSPDVQVGTGATFSPTMSGSYYVVGTNGVCTASTKGSATQITVIDIRCGKDNQDKVNVCHKKNGEHGNGTIGDNAHTLCVSVNAVPAHLAHGDCLGSCDEEESRMAPSASQLPNQLSSDALPAVYPNPSNGRVQVNMAKSKANEVQIVNSRGVVVERKAATGAQSMAFDLGRYGKGLYLVKIISGKEVQTLKVMVQE